MLTIRQISQEIGLSYNTTRLRLKKNKSVNGLYHTKAINSVRKINIHRMNSSKKIMIVRYWIANNKPTAYSVAKDLNLRDDTVFKIINKYKKDDCIIVKSKMNL